MSKQKYYYAVVHKETGGLLIEDKKLPIYWKKNIAESTAEIYIDHIVQKISIDDFEKILLKQPNKKAA